MKTIHALLVTTGLMATASLHAQFTLYEDNFDSYGDGNTINGATTWNPKWASGTDQQDLFLGTASGTAELNGTTATSNYHTAGKFGFSATGTDTVTLSLDFNYTHTADGVITGDQVNDAFFALGITTTDAWWSGTNKYQSVANRGGAIGVAPGVAPWIEGWLDAGATGVNHAVGGTSNWLTVQAVVSVGLDGDYQLVTSILNSGGTNLVTSSAQDTNILAGTTLYALMTSGTHPSTDGGTTPATTLEVDMHISSVEVDNFIITSSVPEPSTYALLAGIVTLGVAATRRRK